VARPRRRTSHSPAFTVIATKELISVRSSERSGALVRFYNSRVARWKEHFYWDGNRIEALTDIGEVTIRLFEFNHPERIAFRQLLTELGRYPTVEALALVRE